MDLLKRKFVLLTAGTCLLLLYVHEQTSIFQVSYGIEKKERAVAKLSEEYKRMKFQVSRLRSPHALSKRMKELSVELTMPTDREVITVLKPKVTLVVPKASSVSPLQWLTPLHFIKEAQAKTSKG